MKTTYYINTVNNSKGYTLLLGGGPGQDSFRYKDLFNSNLIIIKYNSELKESKNNTKNLIKEILNIIKKERIEIDKIVGFSFGSYLGLRLIKDLKPLEVISIGFLYKFSQLLKVYNESSIKTLYLTLKESNSLSFLQQTEYIKENLNLMGYNDIKLQLKDYEDLKLQLYYERNNYFEEDSLKEKDLNIHLTFLSGTNDRLTPFSNIQEFIEEFPKLNCKIEKRNGNHSLSLWKDLINK